MRWRDLPHERLNEQSGVVGTSQLLDWGAATHDVRRWVRARRLTRMARGVFVTHTAVPTQLQQWWAATLVAPGSALGGEAAFRFGMGQLSAPDPAGRVPIELVVPAGVRKRPNGPLVVRRLEHFGERVLTNGLPRLRFEHAVLAMALRQANEADLMGLLTQACGSRRTSATRVAAALDTYRRFAGRDVISGLLHDIDGGTNSVAEHHFVRRVVRAHGLPHASQQVRRWRGDHVRYHDFEFAAWALVVEIDGFAFHSDARARDLDLVRDLTNRVEGRETIRLGFRQVSDRACETAQLLADVLRQRGWLGALSGCGRGCPIEPDLVGDVAR